MALIFDSWDDVVAFACALPDVEMLSFYGTPCPKLNGKALASPGREPGSFAVMCKPDEKEILLETDPDTFWQTPHYEGWHALLVRYSRSEEHTSELQSLMRISYAVFCLKKKKNNNTK